MEAEGGGCACITAEARPSVVLLRNMLALFKGKAAGWYRYGEL